MPGLTIDGAKIEVGAGLTVLQACELAGKEIPRFCYHERLSVAGNCRMCLVEMERAPKPIASCAMPVADGMVIRTDTDTVRKARRGVMEFLLINHPLDCPICDQGGECDLQDQAMAYGGDRSRYVENKRAVADKHMGPLIKTVMTRCIHCTRCVRFATEVAGVPELGLLGRGEKAEITTLLEKSLASELSGNVVDLCPVGALTARPYAFVARPWELTRTESIDVMDGVGSAIRIDSRGPEVLRVLPRLNEPVNEEWLSDKGRHACDGLKRQRLDRPYVRENGKLRPVAWSDAFAAVRARLRGLGGAEIGAIAGDLCDAESMLALRMLLDRLGCANRDCRQDGAQIDPGDRAGYLLNSGIAGLETADAVLLVGCNPRLEAPLVNTRLRKAWLYGGARIGLLGAPADLTYPVTHIGTGPDTLTALLAGQHDFAAILARASRPAIIIGAAALARPDGLAIQTMARDLAAQVGAIRPAGHGDTDGAGGAAGHDWNGFNMLHGAAARVGGLDLGFVPGPGGLDTAGIVAAAGRGAIRLVYLLGADEVDMQALGDAFVVYQGHHGDAGAHRADVILPGAAYTEKHGTYVNTEGRVQIARPAVPPPGEAREDWTIIRALSDHIDVSDNIDVSGDRDGSGDRGGGLDFATLGDVRAALVAANPVFDCIDSLTPAPWRPPARPAGPVSAAGFAPPVAGYYQTDPISRASRTMAACAAEFGSGDRAGATAATGATGAIAATGEGAGV